MSNEHGPAPKPHAPRIVTGIVPWASAHYPGDVVDCLAWALAIVTDARASEHYPGDVVDCLAWALAIVTDARASEQNRLVQGNKMPRPVLFDSRRTFIDTKPFEKNITVLDI